MLKSGLLKANQIRAMQPLCASCASKSIVRLVRVLQLMFCFYYYSFLSKGGIKSSKDEDKLECFDVKDGGRLYLKVGFYIVTGQSYMYVCFRTVMLKV